jgi:hypothetical protein
VLGIWDFSDIIVRAGLVPAILSSIPLKVRGIKGGYDSVEVFIRNSP